MNGLLVLLDKRAERYTVSADIVRFWVDYEDVPGDIIRSVILEFEESECGFTNIRIKASDNREVYNRVCESYLHHPGVIDLRGLNIDDIEEN